MAYFRNQRGQIFQVGGDRFQRRSAYVGGDVLMGEDAIIGQEEMAMAAANGGVSNSLLAEVAAARAAGGFVATQKQRAPVAFYQMLPMSRDFAANERFTFSLQPQRTFRVDNLLVTSPEGPFFELEGWAVGQENMFVANGSVNCAAFSEGAAQRALGMRGFTANPGTIINLQIVNLDDEPHRFSGFLSGPTFMAIG